MRSVLAALCEELVRVKERSTCSCAATASTPPDLDSLLAPLRQIADTLAVLGFGQPRKVIIDQLAVVLSLAQGQREPNDAILMDVAGALLYVEATLAGMVGTVEPESQEDSRLPTTDLTQIHQIVIKEARICLRQAKDMIVDYIDADWDRQHLQALPALLTQVRGALAMIPLSRAASLVETCNHFIREHLLLEPRQPGWQELDSLADVITSIEYYLERLSDDPQAPGEQLLDVAQKSLASTRVFPQRTACAGAGRMCSAPSEAQVMQTCRSWMPRHIVQALADVLASPVSALNPPALDTPGSLLPPPAGEEPVDEELREVFLEETDEVLEILREYLPRWSANPAQPLGPERTAPRLPYPQGQWPDGARPGAGRTGLGGGKPAQPRAGTQRGAWRAACSSCSAMCWICCRNWWPNIAADAQRQRNDVDQLAARAHALAKGDDAAGR